MIQDTPDCTTERAAHLLARRITAYWRRRGCDINARVERISHRDGREFAPIFCVRSDMVGGWPRDWRAAA